MAALARQDLREFEEELRGLSEGLTRVVDADAVLLSRPSGDEYLQVTLTLAVPPAGQEIWPLEEAFALRQRVRGLADGLGVGEVEITVTSGEADDEDGDAEGEESELG